MSTNETRSLVVTEKHDLWSIYLTVVKLLLLAVLTIVMTKPTGSISGHIALEQKGFNLYSYDMRQNKVYALAQGPRGDESIERGAWVKPDGTFRIDQLPVGEYTLKVHAQGFSTVHQSGIFVEDGKVTDFPKTITMSILQPSISVASNSRVFTTKENPTFWINATGGTHAKVQVYRKDFISLLKQGEMSSDDMDVSSELQFYHSSPRLLDMVSGGHPVTTFNRDLSLDENDSAHANFKLEKPLPPGDYFVVGELANAEGSTDRNLMWFTVTDIGLVVKQAPDRTLVRAVDFNTLRPRAGVKVATYLMDRSHITDTLASGVTGADGFVSLKSAEGIENGNLLTVGTQADQHAYGAAWYYTNRSDTYRTYFYTERPVYRLGQTVYFKAIIRQSTPSGYARPESGMAVSVVVEDPDNNKLWEKDLRTNDHGTINGTVDIPEDAKTGAYQITFTYPDDTKAYERFEVSQYRKPEYQVEVSTDQPRVVAGSKVTAHVRATYYFGGPVRNARVKYSVYSSSDWSTRYSLMDRPGYYSYFDDWNEDESYSENYVDYGGSYITEGYAQTDDNGEAKIEFDSRAIVPDRSHPYAWQYLDQRYKIEAEVTDISRMSVISSGSVSITAGDFALFVKPNYFVLRSGDPLSVDISAVDYDRKPVAGQKVTVQLVRWPYDTVQHAYRPEEVEQEYTVTTGDNGSGRVSFNTKGALPTDTYYVVAEAADAAGHVVHDEESIWVANSSFPFRLSGSDVNKEPLSLKLDKQVFKPGETAKVMVSAPFTGSEGAEAIVTVEGPHLYSYKVVPMTSTAQLVEVPIKAEYEPNVFVSVAVVGQKKQFYTQSKILKVSPAEHFLSLDVSTDRKKYKPGDKVTYTIHAKFQDGKPAANTELSLGVVDESIYAIRAETAPDIGKCFYARRNNSVTTFCSFPEQYSGGPDKIEPKVRKDFRDTAAWVPELRTNKEGVAVATIKLPDNLTTWRATVRGIDTDVDVGSAINKIICTQDMILRLALPRFFTEGDEGVVSAIVHNYTDTPQTVKVTLTPPVQFQITQPLVVERPVAPDKAERFQWPVKIVSSGQAKILCKAVGQTAGDAVERKIPVRSLGLPAFSAKSGVMTADPDQVSLPVGLSKDAAPETAQYNLSLAASSIGPVLGNFSKLIEYPYGCTEQTMSRLMPSVVAMRLNQALHVPLAPGMKEKFQVVYEKAMRKLDDYQHGDGGWGWWETDNSNIYLTAHVLEGYYLLRQCGYEVDAERTKRGLDWIAKALPQIQKQLSDPKLMHDHYSDMESYVDVAKAMYTAGLYGQRPAPAFITQLSKKANSLTPETLSYLTMAATASGDSQAAGTFYKQLIAIANVHENYTDWDHSEALLKRLGSKTESGEVIPYTYRFTGTETTALALRAVMAMEPDNSARIESIKNWILLQRDREGWDNTKTTAAVFIALLDEELAARSHGKPDFSVVADLSGAALASLTFGGANVYGPEQNINVPVSMTPQKLDVKKVGPGRLYYSSLVTYMRHLKPGDVIAEKSLPGGVHLSRQFFRLVPDKVSSDGSIHFSTHQITDATLHAGETVLMKVNVESPITLPYVIVEAALPSGAEVIENDPRKGMTEGESTDNSGISVDWGEWWWTHQDTLDDRIVFFVTSMPAGKHEFWTMVRMEMPGTFQINPMSMEGMYTKKVRAYSGLDYLKVVE